MLCNPMLKTWKNIRNDTHTHTRMHCTISYCTQKFDAGIELKNADGFLLANSNTTPYHYDLMQHGRPIKFFLVGFLCHHTFVTYLCTPNGIYGEKCSCCCFLVSSFHYHWRTESHRITAEQASMRKTQNVISSFVHKNIKIIWDRIFFFGGF